MSRQSLHRASAFAALFLSAAVGSSMAAPAPRAKEPPASRSEEPIVPRLAVPFHGDPERFAYVGQIEVRFAEDRVAGVSDPEWFSFGRVGAFVLARPSRRIELAWQAGWHRSTDDFTVERAEVGVRVKGSMELHAGIFLTPLGRTNLTHDAPRYEFAERSLVATQLIGVPNAQLGVGLRGLKGAGEATPISYELDLVTGLDDGLILDASGGTRVPEGRNNYGDNNGMPALAGRVATRLSRDSEAGLGAQSGKYNVTDLDGVQVDESRFVHLVVADGTTRVARFGIAAEAAMAMIDVPPGLGALYAERQWGASLEIVRSLREPIFCGWKSSRLSAALRADAVDLDRGIQGDSRSRLSASLNVHRLPYAVTRFGWYYEIRRDRFNNETPFAGLTFTAATYF